MNIRNNKPQDDQERKELFVLVNIDQDIRKYKRYNPLRHVELTPIEMKVSEVRKLNMRYYQQHAALRKNATGKSVEVDASKETRKYAPYKESPGRMLFGNTYTKPKKLSLLQSISKNEALASQFQSEMTTVLALNYLFPKSSSSTSQVTTSNNSEINQVGSIELANDAQDVNENDLNAFIADFNATPTDLTQEEINLLDKMFEPPDEELSKALRF